MDCREIRVLGNGSFGKTVLLEYQSREIVAKFMRFAQRRITNDQQTVFTRTVEQITALFHPCILSFIGSSQIADDQAIILAQFMNVGSLTSLLDEDPKPPWWSPTSVTIIIMGILLGMVYAHQSGLYHGNLKPNNILLDVAHHVRLADFGSMQWVEAGIVREVSDESSLYADHGLYYDDEKDPFAGDVYSFGLILYEMIMIGRGPHDAIKRMTLNKIIGGTRPEVPSDFNLILRNLVDDCWSSNPKYRPKFTDIVQLFEKNQYQLLAGVRTEEVQAYVKYMNEFLRER
jgi:serine/threonine protein kinase